MNSRTDSGKGFLIPPENGVRIGNSWVPLTPGNSILQRSNGIPVQRHGNEAGITNRHELIGTPAQSSQATMNYRGANPNFNLIGLMGQNGGSYNLGRNGGSYNLGISPAEKGGFDLNIGSSSQTFGNGSVVWNENPLPQRFGIESAASKSSANGGSTRRLHVEDTPSILDSYTHIDSSWTEGNFTSLLLGNESPKLELSHWTNGDTVTQKAQDGLPIPFWPNYNLNSPPRPEADATSSTNNFFPFAPVTPDHAKQFPSRHSEILNFPLDESSSQEKDKQENLLTSAVSNANENSNQLLQHIVDSSSAAVSTQFTEKNISEQGDDQGIDLNKTPQQKPPRRRKHRPKVIIEGKPKRTPKPKTPHNTSKENPSGKRKYVRKNLEASAAQQTGATDEVTLKPKTPNTSSKENPSGKRKYVRKKNLEATGTQQTGGTDDVTAKACRRKLNFDLGSHKKDMSSGKTVNPCVEINQENIAAFNFNLDSQATGLSTGINCLGQAVPTEINMQNRYISLNQETGCTSNITHSVNQMPAQLQMPERCAPAAPQTAIKHNTINVIARSANMRNTSFFQTTSKDGGSQEHHHIQGALNRNILQANDTHLNPEPARQVTWHSTPQLEERNMADFNEKRGSKRAYLHATEQAGPSSENRMGSLYLCVEKYQVDSCNISRHNFNARCPETCENNRLGNGFHTTESNNSCNAVAKVGCGEVITEDRTRVYANSLMSQTDGRIYSHFVSDKTSKKLKNGVHGIGDQGCSSSISAKHYLQKQRTASELHPNAERISEKTSSGSTQVLGLSSTTVIANPNLLSSTLHRKASTSGSKQVIETSRAIIPVMRHNMAPISSDLVPTFTNKVLLLEKKNASNDYQQFSTKARGQPRKQPKTFTVDEITWRLQFLNISDRSKANGEESNALVPYKGDGKMVLYEGNDPLRKRKPRPKVDLDPETDRLWKLLMGKEGSEGTEAPDKEKEKWWEEERKVFRGRADSFIARMHLVQGDRRFSRWKGSVVDSVIGVFLTQNVSDHLSSSAFMSLAAKFPLQSTNSEQRCYQGGPSILAKETEAQIPDSHGTKCYEKIGRQPGYDQAYVTRYESSEQRTEDSTSRTGKTSPESNPNGIAEEKDSSSQNSSDSFVLQVHGETQSYSGSNSEAEDSTRSEHMKKTTSIGIFHSPSTGSLCFDDRSAHWHKQSDDLFNNIRIPRLDKGNNQNTSSIVTHNTNSNAPHMQRPVVDPCQFHMASDLGATEVHFGKLREESTSFLPFLPSTASGFAKGKGIDHMRRRIEHTVEIKSKTVVQENGVPMVQTPTVDRIAYQNRHPTQLESSSQSIPQTGNDQLHLSPHQHKFGTFQLETTLVSEPLMPTEAVSTRQNGTRYRDTNDLKDTSQVFGVEERSTVVDKPKVAQTKAVEILATEQANFSGETTTGASVNMASARKGKIKTEKSKPVDWDGLRKMVQPSGRSKERSKDAMDSLDYETMRCADVNAISNAIKERGMNNMLAERIKDFLNRLVREHGSIDLEWLRDVPPDKAKDYLLSVRGLGLKSVECVRLLTLHHLAFPVDTNVGRIAVRLGWVPLQPLPESLQLHLLELYPVLESIQKYLWPRLCKLDQRTLYELHYQMITFGKVFCTKSKPNCNACPMRGECRHFASAFASARLALPGPEEKSIVSSTVPIATKERPAMAINPMPLLPAGSTETKGIGSVAGNYEPIVEEPTTPEPETEEITASDIEDAFYEDPDEIPTIKLNVEQFTMNLHSYMQDKMELQEGDMSKALVALNAEAASIPTPKLKNVSRLRTEHQVYELPDSHPLLEGLDKREPDDPSPYLLAIWTPGETANSTQPPEKRCESQELGTLCNEKTCFSCNSVREASTQTVRGTLLVPCRTAMRGSFPLNGTYFQVNEVFADHESSLNPIDVPRAWIWNLPRRTVYFGTSVSTIFKGLPTEGIQYCFWRGFVCVRGFDQKTRAPRPLMARLHFPASKLVKTKNEAK